MIEIIPAIDIIEGKAVRLRQGRFSERINYELSPLEIARSYQDLGFKRLHVVDLSAAKQGSLCNLEFLEVLLSQTSLKIDYGGGVRSAFEIERLLRAGVNQINIGSLALKEPALLIDLLSKYGPDRLILAADVLGEEMLSEAWINRSGLNLFEKLPLFCDANLKYLCVTDVSRDGSLSSPNFELYRALRSAYPQLYLIASGGVSSLADIENLQELGVKAVIVGRALLEGRIGLKEIASYLC